MYIASGLEWLDSGGGTRSRDRAGLAEEEQSGFLLNPGIVSDCSRRQRLLASGAAAAAAIQYKYCKFYYL